MDHLLFASASGFLENNILPLLKRQFDVKTMGLSCADTYNVNIANTVTTLNESFDVVYMLTGKRMLYQRATKRGSRFLIPIIKGL